MRHLDRFLIIIALVLFLLPVQSAFAVYPDEMLKDPVLEKRARVISTGLRCLVCQNQSIDDSDADLARDLRILVRERLTKGDTNDQVLDYLVARFGEYVLLKPRLSARTYILWATPIVLILIGGIVVVVSARKRSKHRPIPLSEDEQAALEKLLNERKELA